MTGSPSPHNQHASQGTTGELLQMMTSQFQQTERLPPEQLLAHQLRAAGFLLEHVWQHSDFHRTRLSCTGWRPGTPLDAESWRRLPILSRQDVRIAGQSLFSREIPPHHGQRIAAHTSGSTGEPVNVMGTGLTALYWSALTLRDYDWHGADYTASVATIRHFFDEGIGQPPEGTSLPHWGGPVASVRDTGPAAVLNLSADVKVQARWLVRQNPEHLVTMPTVLQALLEHFARHSLALPRLRLVRTVGELVTPELRELCHSVWQVPIIDVYSSQELGYIALQCPESKHYHVPAESLLVEVLDEDDRPCRPGEVGRVVTTSLHNYATGLIRYEVGDYAEVAPPCACGRTLPTLARIIGRTRNMVVLPDGTRHWPLVGFSRFRDVAPVRQYQLVQHAIDDIEVRFSIERELYSGEQAALSTIIQSALGYPFPLRYTCSTAPLPRTAGGKFEEFISKVA